MLPGPLLETPGPHTTFLASHTISSSPFKGAPTSAVRGVGGSYSQGHFSVEVRTNPLALVQPNFLKVRDFPNVHP